MKEYEIGGMSCAACSARVEKAICSVSGVSSCAVSLLTHSASVEGNINDEDIINAVKNAGYTASVKNEKITVESYQDAEQKEVRTTLRRLVASILFLLALMYS